MKTDPSLAYCTEGELEAIVRAGRYASLELEWRRSNREAFDRRLSENDRDFEEVNVGRMK